MINIAIIGASGYTGAQMCQLIEQHDQLNLTGIYVSENSLDKGKNINELYPHLAHEVSATLTPLTDESFSNI